jgi:hypothetical protein
VFPYLWERALLATRDYLLPTGRNLSFLDDKNREASWKRLLRADTRVPDREARRDVVRRVLARIDPKNVETSLQRVIAEGVKGDDTIPVPGFRSRFVDEPRLIAYCEMRMLRLEEGSTFLLTKARRSGRHVDLYIYQLYLRLIDRHAELAPFKPELIPQLGTYPRSQIRLSKAVDGATLKVEKSGEVMQLHLQIPRIIREVATSLTEWTVKGDTLLRWVDPGFAEATIFAAVSAVQLFSNEANIVQQDDTAMPRDDLLAIPM